MSITIPAWALAFAVCLPSALVAAMIRRIEKRIEKKEQEREKLDAARSENERLAVQATWAAIALGEATARAVQRIPDAKCNGDMEQALNYAANVKHEQKDFLAKQGIEAMYIKRKD